MSLCVLVLRGAKVLYCATLAVFNRGRTEVEGGLFLP